jgi:predicted Holliday junction resolvase-like endonuclease
MGSKTVFKLLFFVLCFILLSACGYIKDMKEKLNSHDAPVNVRTEEPASPTDRNVNPADQSSKKDLNNGNSTNKGDDANAVSNDKSNELSKSDSNPDQSTNK